MTMAGTDLAGIDLGKTQLGNVAEWVAAVGTVGALVMAYRLLRKELATFREAATDKERQQAQSVGAWLEFVRREPTVQGGGAVSAFMGASSTLTLFVRNASAAPIYDTVVQFTSRGTATGTVEVGVVGPAATYEAPVRHEDVGYEANTVGIPQEVFAGLDVSVSVRFVDSAERAWVRDGHGVLTRQP